MSSQVALIANEPVRALSSERPARQLSEAQRAGAQAVTERSSPSPGAAPRPVPAASPQIDAAVENIREFVADMQRELQFSVDEDSGRTIITVIDSGSGRIIRQIPPEELLELARSVADGAFNLIDRRA